jgi:hypothetical protein
MAITANSVATTDTLEKLRQEYNSLRTDVSGIDSGVLNINTWIFEGATADEYETTIAVVDPTADRTITFPNATGTVALSGANITVADAGNIGSTSDPDAIAIAANGVVTLSQDLVVQGDYTVNGDTTTINTATLSVEDPLIILASGNNGADTVDIGIYGLYDTSGSLDLYAGLFRDANDSGKWKLFKDNQATPTTTVNTSGTGYAVATLVANLEGAVTGNVTGDASGTAATVTGAAQTNITSLGTLTALQVDNVNINLNTITSSDSNGALTLDANGTGAVNVIRTINANAATTYTLALTDAGKIITSTNASAQTITIPPNSSIAFPIGTQIEVYNLGATVTSVQGGSGVTLNGVSTGTGALTAQYSAVSIFKIATDTWLMAGAHGVVA